MEAPTDVFQQSLCYIVPLVTIFCMKGETGSHLLLMPLLLCAFLVSPEGKKDCVELSRLQGKHQGVGTAGMRRRLRICPPLLSMISMNDERLKLPF